MQQSQVQVISNLDNYYIQVIATATEWKEAIYQTLEIPSYRRNSGQLLGEQGRSNASHEVKTAIIFIPKFQQRF
ncbi:hypothetical protein [Hydrocoleum sp. CS-953]|uniref:hypothetical protein n=1 Tax=Dapis sp. BLCC M172 TaxID=2975281 RepID=UPI000B9B54C7|nr:hypothetical protein AFK68_25465 [Hydrocoleum sp. CS-953]